MQTEGVTARLTDKDIFARYKRTAWLGDLDFFVRSQDRHLTEALRADAAALRVLLAEDEQKNRRPAAHQKVYRALVDRYWTSRRDGHTHFPGVAKRVAHTVDLRAAEASLEGSAGLLLTALFAGAAPGDEDPAKTEALQERVTLTHRAALRLQALQAVDLDTLYEADPVVPVEADAVEGDPADPQQPPAQSRGLKVWAYTWPGMSGTIEAASEAEARRLIRETHQLKWMPNGARVTRHQEAA